MYSEKDYSIPTNVETSSETNFTLLKPFLLCPGGSWLNSGGSYFDKEKRHEEPRTKSKNQEERKSTECLIKRHLRKSLLEVYRLEGTLQEK